MSDPAIDAAQRAWMAGPASEFEFRPHEDGLWTPAAMVAAAREALTPVEAEIEDMREEFRVGAYDAGVGMGVRHALDRIAKHVYPSEEL